MFYLPGDGAPDNDRRMWWPLVLMFGVLGLLALFAIFGDSINLHGLLP